MFRLSSLVVSRKTANPQSYANSRRAVLMARYCKTCADPKDILKVQIALKATKETKNAKRSAVPR